METTDKITLSEYSLSELAAAKERLDGYKNCLVSERSFAIRGIEVKESILKINQDSYKLIWCRDSLQELKVDGRDNNLFWCDFNPELNNDSRHKSEDQARVSTMNSFIKYWCYQ